MWQFSSPDLPTSINAVQDLPTGAPLFVVETGQSLAPLARISLGSAYNSPGVVPGFTPTSLSVTPTGGGGGVFTATLPATVTHLTAISQNGITWVPARNPDQPQPGEFTWTAPTVNLYTSRELPIIPGLAVKVQAGAEALPTNWLNPSLFEAFYDLPVMGQIQWTTTLENHPSGSIALFADGGTIAAVRQRFKQGTEFTIGGIGFYVRSYREKLKNTKQCPALEYEIAIGLAGKWERKKYQRPVFLNSAAAQRRSPTSAQPYQDNECSILNPVQPGQPTQRRFKISVQELAAQNGVPFVGFSPPIMRDQDLQQILSEARQTRDYLLMNLAGRYLSGGIRNTAEFGSWDVRIPRESARDATGSWDSSARDLLRQNGAFIDYNRPEAVLARSIDDVQTWQYSPLELDITGKGDCEHDTLDRFGYAVEYAAVKLSGLFSETPFPPLYEESMAMPQYPPQIRWIKKPPVKKAFYTGEADADQCPPELTWITSMGQCFDCSGKTRERTWVEQEDGVTMRATRQLYGLIFYSTDVYNPNYNGLKALAAPYWGLILEEVTETVIDDPTGYFLGTRITGRKRARYKQETDQLELFAIDPGDPHHDTYKFRWLAIQGGEGKLLKQNTSFYPDAIEKPPTDAYKKCLPDGTSALVSVEDPNYAPSMIEVASRSFRSCYGAIQNPDSTADQPLPNLCTGEEHETIRTLEIIPNPTRSYSLSTNPAQQNQKPGENNGDLFVAWEYESNSQGPQFQEVTTRRNHTENPGRPEPAQRRPGQFTREQYELPHGADPNAWQDPYRQKYEFVLCTPGYSGLEPSSGSVSFPYALYRSQALLAARTDLTIRDVQESVDFSYQLPFNTDLKPFDKVVLTPAGDTYFTRVLSINRVIQIYGKVGDFPFVVWNPMNVAGGIDRVIPINRIKRPLPLGPYRAASFTNTSNGLVLGDLSLGSLEKAKGRGN